MFDAHTHLNHEELFPSWKDYLSRFVVAGGKGLVNIGANKEYNSHGILIAQESVKLFPGIIVKSTAGIHPCDVKEGEDLLTLVSELKDFVQDYPEEVVAIGECGIDLYFPESVSLVVQQQLFRLQCGLAKNLGLPIVIHSRDAFRETLEVLLEYPDLKIYFHCWSYGPEELCLCLEYFPQIFFGFTGVVTYPKASLVRESLQAVPLSSFLLETDAPYLPPVPFRGKQNEPAYLQYVYDYVSEFLQIEKSELEKQVEKNFRSFYGL